MHLLVGWNALYELLVRLKIAKLQHQFPDENETGNLCLFGSLQNEEPPAKCTTNHRMRFPLESTP